MRRYLLFILLLSASIVGLAQSQNAQYTFPAEFEKIDAIWMGWGVTTYTDTATKEDVEKIRLQMVQALTPYVRIHLIVNDTAQRNLLIRKFLSLKIDTSKISYFFSPNWNFWLR